MYCIYMLHADLQQRLQDIWTKHYKTQMSHEKTRVLSIILIVS